MGDDGGHPALGMGPSDGAAVGRGRAMHPGWWGFFGLLGVLVVVGLVASIVQGMWFVFGAVLIGCVVLGVWGLWEACLRPDWRRVVLSDEVPSDPVVRAAAVERIRTERSSGGVAWRSWNGIATIVILICALVFLAGNSVGYGPHTFILIGVLVAAGLVTAVLARCFAAVSRRVWASDVEEGSGASGGLLGGGDVDGVDWLEEERLLASATPRAVHRASIHNGMRLASLMIMFLLIAVGISWMLVRFGVAVPGAVGAWSSGMWAVVMGLPVPLLVGILVQHTDRAQERAVRESNELLYGNAEGGPPSQSRLEEMEEIVRGHRQSRGGA